MKASCIWKFASWGKFWLVEDTSIYAALAYSSSGTPKPGEDITGVCPHSWAVQVWKYSTFNYQWKWLVMLASTQAVTDILLSPARINAPHSISGRSSPSLFYVPPRTDVLCVPLPFTGAAAPLLAVSPVSFAELDSSCQQKSLGLASFLSLRKLKETWVPSAPTDTASLGRLAMLLMISCLIKELSTESKCWHKAAGAEALPLQLSSQHGFLLKRPLLAPAASLLPLLCPAMLRQSSSSSLTPFFFFTCCLASGCSVFLHLLSMEVAEWCGALLKEAKQAGQEAFRRCI